MYCIDLNFGRAKLWRIWRIDSNLPNLTLQSIFLTMRTRAILNLSADKTDKKLRDPRGSLCKKVPLSSIERANLTLHSVAPIRSSACPYLDAHMDPWIRGTDGHLIFVLYLWQLRIIISATKANSLDLWCASKCWQVCWIALNRNVQRNPIHQILTLQIFDSPKFSPAKFRSIGTYASRKYRAQYL